MTSTDFNDISNEEAAREQVKNAEAVQETDVEIITRLANLPSMEYDRVREKEAKRLGVRITTLDCEVAKARGGETENDARGTAVEFEAIDPWGESVDGATLLDDLAATFKRYLVLPKSAESILALWVVHTYAIDAAHATPYLHVKSPVARCGKSKLLDLLEALVYRHLKFSNASSATIFRVIEAHHPTLLIDEADTYIKDNEDLRGILNDGYRPGGKVLRAVPSGDDFEPRFFSVWGAKAIAGIGRLPRTIEDRSITISMKRKSKSETVGRLRWRTIGGALLPLRRCITRWVKDNATTLHAADPDIPTELNDRTAEVCEILFAIADAVGGKWPKHAREVAKALSGAGDTDAELKGVQLLADLRQLFKERNADRLSSEEIANALVEMEDRPWAEYRKGHPITKHGVAKLLEPFDIKPGALRFPGGRAGCSGYELSWFKDAFSRYLGNSGNSTSTTQQTSWGAASSDFSNLNKDKDVEVEKPPKAAPDNSCCDVEVEHSENGARASNGEKLEEVVEGADFTTMPDFPSLSDDRYWNGLVESLPYSADDRDNKARF
jgi:putative DNA primase/helicase